MKNPRYADFAAAHDEAFTTNMCNPCIAWTHETGFEVVSKIHIENGYQVDWFCEATISANTGARNPSAYKGHWPEIAEEIKETKS